jgi:hypothetical protein
MSLSFYSLAILSIIHVDLCVAAALSAVKEHAKLPWSVPQEPSKSNSPSLPISGTQPVETSSVADEKTLSTEGKAEAKVETDPAEETQTDSSTTRILDSHHFEKALKEITPSASEQMGTLADLRKWNEEFGEGGRKRGRRIWGGKFGFTVKSDDQTEEGRVQQP